MSRWNKLDVCLLTVVIGVFLWSGIGPKDRFTWFLEVLPVLVGIPILLATNNRFRLSPLTRVAIAVHCVILMVGGHFTYAEVPLFDWLRNSLGWSRNHYDRLGHFAQGFVPALLAREIILRRTPLRPGRWLVLFVTSFCLAFSAFYELIEWWVAVATGEAADAFLGTQGDVWDSQWDMFMALIGSLAAQFTFARLQDRFISINFEKDSS